MNLAEATIPQLKNHTWSNIVGLKAKPQRFFQPKSLSDLQHIVQFAERENLAVRTVGSGHSFTDIAMTNDVMIAPSKHLNKIIPMDANALKESSWQQNLIQVESGISIQQLNKKLDKKGLALINMGAIDEQTISGAISTNTHGTGLDYPSMVGMVHSMVLVAAGGKAYRIEPTNGITQPSKCKETNIELIQDDEVFYSAVLGLGAMGVVYSYVLEVQPKFWLCESRTVTTWTEVKKMLLDDTEPLFQAYDLKLNKKKYHRKPRGLFILINPFEQKRKGQKDHTCVITKFMEIPRPKFFTNPFARSRNLLGGIVGKKPLARAAYAIAERRANNSPDKLPGVIQTSLTTMKDKKFAQKSFKVLHQGTEYLMSKGYGCEFAHNYKEKNFVNAIEAIFEKMKTLENTPELYPSSPLGLRFTQASKHFLAPEYGQDVCYIANPVYVKQKRASDIVNYYQDIHLAHGGKPHWGKMTNKIEGRTDLFEQWYPKLPAWQKTVERFNPNGTFTNDFILRMGLLESKEVLLDA